MTRSLLYYSSILYYCYLLVISKFIFVDIIVSIRLLYNILQQLGYMLQILAKLHGHTEQTSTPIQQILKALAQKLNIAMNKITNKIFTF